jgi:hypothetical protein
MLLLANIRAGITIIGSKILWNSAKYNAQVFQHRLCMSESIQVWGSLNIFVTSLFFTVRSC